MTSREENREELSIFLQQLKGNNFEPFILLNYPEIIFHLLDE